MVNSKIKWKVIVDSIGIIVIVLSLVFVGLQLRQSQVIATNEIGLKELESRIAAHGQINDHVSVWVKGLAGEKLSDDDTVIFENLLINVNDITFHSASNYFQLGDHADARIVTGDLAIFLHRNPGARRVWETRENRLAELRKINSPDNWKEISSVGIPYVEWVTGALEKLDQETK